MGFKTVLIIQVFKLNFKATFIYLGAKQRGLSQCLFIRILMAFKTTFLFSGTH